MVDIIYDGLYKLIYLLKHKGGFKGEVVGG